MFSAFQRRKTGKVAYLFSEESGALSKICWAPDTTAAANKLVASQHLFSRALADHHRLQWRCKSARKRPGGQVVRSLHVLLA